MAHKIGILAKKATGGGGSDVTPNAVTFGDIVGFSSPVNSNLVTITGIDTTITLKVSFAAEGTFSYVVNGGTEIDASVQDTFTIQNNNTLIFKHYSFPGGSASYTVTNLSDSSAVLGSGSMLYD